MKLLEYEGKEIFRAAGIPLPVFGGIIDKPAQLPAILKRLKKGPWVLKAQVLAGGRGKAGGVKIAKTPAQAREFAKAMIGMKIATHQTHGETLQVKEVLVEEGVKIEKEFYFSVAVDRKIGSPVIIASSQGGMEIETLAEEHPEQIIKRAVDPVDGLFPFAARALAFELGVPIAHLGSFCKVASSLVRLFIDKDLSLLEVNPLVLTPKGFLALDAKIVTDDNALFRRPEFSSRIDIEASVAELEAKKHDISYVGLDGNIGCMVNGAGLAMGTMDTIALAGGSPANFLDVGGAANQERVERAFKIILKDPKVKTILVNIFGGIVKCDMIAEGILAALKKMKLKVPLVVRLEGTNSDKGREILDHSGTRLITAASLWEAAQKSVEAAESNHGGK